MELNLENEKLGEMLLDYDVIDRDELNHALEFQEDVGGKLGEVLIKLGYTTEDTLIEVIADQQNMKTVDLSELVLPENLIKEIPRDTIVKHEIIPVRLKGETLQLAIHDPFDYESLEEVGLATNYSVEPVLAPRAAIIEAIRDFYPEADMSRSDAPSESDQHTPSNTEDAPPSSPAQDAPSPSVRVQALVDLLVQKGLVDRDELQDAIRERQKSKT